MRAVQNATRFRIISCVIVAVLGLQFIAILGRPGKWSWPFTDYSMYSGSHHEGERIPARHFVTGTTANGAEIPITAEDLGVNMWVFERWAVALQRAAEQQAAPDGAVATGPRTREGGAWPVQRWLKSSWLFGMLKTKPDPDLAPLLLDPLQAKLEPDLVSLRIEDAAVALSREGPVPAPPLVFELNLPLETGN